MVRSLGLEQKCFRLSEGCSVQWTVSAAYFQNISIRRHALVHIIAYQAMLRDPLFSHYTQSRLTLITSAQRKEFKCIELEVRSKTEIVLDFFFFFWQLFRKGFHGTLCQASASLIIAGMDYVISLCIIFSHSRHSSLFFQTFVHFFLILFLKMRICL